MIEFNDMRNQGNYIYIVDFTLKCKLKTFEYGERFNFEKFLKEWEISNRNDVQDSRREKIIIMGPQLKRFGIHFFLFNFFFDSNIPQSSD